MESIKKTQTEQNWKWKIWAVTSEPNLINRIQNMEEGLSGFKDKIEELDSSVKENINLKKISHKTKHSGYLGLYKKTKSINNRSK